MADTAEVLEGLDLRHNLSKLLAIVANVRGAQDACKYQAIDYLGYPFSISENFQMRNTHKTIAQSTEILKELLDIASNAGKEVVVYISMGFGNPYGDPWNVDIVGEWTQKLTSMGVKILSLSDTVGTSSPEIISYLFSNLIPMYPAVEFGAHLHTTPSSWHEKIDAAYKAGCRRYDGAIQGFGGCPMAKDELTGNMPTEKMLSYFTSKKADTNVTWTVFEAAFNQATQVFKAYH
jgi:hydroxymethylglutaryl-CoA lyase